MRRLSQRHTSTKLVILICFAGLLAIALVADLLWASSSSSAYQYIASNWQQQSDIIVPKFNDSSVK
ncbi:hypothetical protein Dimus_003484, partial [Dionaea muscipula]